jgi:hypothetical protein
MASASHTRTLARLSDLDMAILPAGDSLALSPACAFTTKMPCLPRPLQPLYIHSTPPLAGVDLEVTWYFITVGAELGCGSSKVGGSTWRFGPCSSFFCCPPQKAA